MLRISIQLISANGPEHDKLLGVMDIANDGSLGNNDKGNYIGRVYRKSSLPKAGWQDGGILRKGEVKDYPRNSYNVWRLVFRMLKDCFPEEK